MKNKTTCETCKTEFEYTQIFISGKEYFKPNECTGCGDKRIEEVRKNNDDNDHRDACDRWLKICPKQYRDTDFAKLPERAQLILQRDRNRDQSKGLGLHGLSGAGKTRICFALLHRRHKLGYSCAAISGIRFRDTVMDQFSSEPMEVSIAKNRLEELRTVDHLFFDEIGKGITSRTEQDLCGLLEQRTSEGLITDWTSNSNEAQLRALLKNDDTREAIIRRLFAAEFTQVVAV